MAVTDAAIVVRSVAEAVVDLGAIAHNSRILSDRALAGGAATMAVVKADGFGHGIVPVARTAVEHGIGWLGVTSVVEALTLRADGIDAPNLDRLYGIDDDFGHAILADVDLSVSSAEHLRAISAGAARVGRRANVHLKIDTGLTRNGVAFDEWPLLVRAARRCEQLGTVKVRGVWSHLAAADDPGNPSIAAQVSRFTEGVELARAAGLDPALRHLANSAAILDLPETHFDLVRAGIALYGIEPMPGHSTGLRRAMTFRARTVNVKRVPAGTGVSYMHEYHTPESTTVVLVPVGFADGVPRIAGNKAEVLVAGRRRPIAGRVAMDQFVVDAGDLPVRLGDEVVLFGPGDAGEPTVEDWAAWAQTNPHEILTGIGARVPRRYLHVRHGM